MGTTSDRILLRNWPLAVRVLITVFLLCVGLGYLSAMVQLHFQVASAGQVLPTGDDAVLAYYGHASHSQMERLLTADVSKPFNGSGSMRAAFTTKSAGWATLVDQPKDKEAVAARPREVPNLLQIMLEAEATKPVVFAPGLSKDDILKQVKERDRKKQFNGDPAQGTMRPAFYTRGGGWRPTERLEGDKLRAALAERDGERLALLDWVNKGLNKEAYDQDKYLLVGDLQKLPITEEFLLEEDDKRYALIASILESRCVRCHRETAGGEPAKYPLETYEQILVYADKGQAKNPPPADGSKDPHARLLAERDGERLALIAWIREKAPKDAYEQDRLPLKDELANHPITEAFVAVGKDGQRYAKIQSILEARCVRCHAAEAGGAPAQYPLETYEEVKAYTAPEQGGGMSLQKLAQTTHVHLLGFSMLYGLTGLIFAFTSFPFWVRLILAPWPLVWQVVDISCWWLGRVDPIYAKAIVVTGGLVAMGLMAQVVLSLLNMYGAKGKLVVVVLLLAGMAGMGGLYLKVVGPHLETEKSALPTLAAK
jgi:hypothetical protein